MNSFYSWEELKELGFKFLGGRDILLSRKASIYGAENISIGNHTRIDDFCILSGDITIGEYVHISAFCGLYGGTAGIFLEDFCTVSSRNAIYAISDDYSGNAMTNPTVPEQYRQVESGIVHLGRYSILGTGCTVLPAVTVGEGASVGAMSLISRDVEPWTMNVGIPCRKIKERSRKLLEYAEKMKKEIQDHE